MAAPGDEGWVQAMEGTEMSGVFDPDPDRDGTPATLVWRVTQLDQFGDVVAQQVVWADDAEEAAMLSGYKNAKVERLG